MIDTQKNPTLLHASNKGADWPALPCSLISAFVISSLHAKNYLSKLDSEKISSLSLWLGLGVGARPVLKPEGRTVFLLLGQYKERTLSTVLIEGDYNHATTIQ